MIMLFIFSIVRPVSSTTCSLDRADNRFCTFLEAAINFKAVFCEFAFKGFGSFSNENLLPGEKVA
jgi:hypothetical protein